jgi:hypothetical protein
MSRDKLTRGVCALTALATIFAADGCGTGWARRTRPPPPPKERPPPEDQPTSTRPASAPARRHKTASSFFHHRPGGVVAGTRSLAEAHSPAPRLLDEATDAAADRAGDHCPATPSLPRRGVPPAAAQGAPRIAPGAAPDPLSEASPPEHTYPFDVSWAASAAGPAEAGPSTRGDVLASPRAHGPAGRGQRS